MKPIDLTKLARKYQDKNIIYPMLRNLMLNHLVGKHCFVVDYKDKILKVFHSRPQAKWEDPKDVLWGDPPVNGPAMYVDLVSATIIENICWIHNLAPRVLDLVKVKIGDNKYWAQLIEKMGGEFAEDHIKAHDTYNQVKILGKQYGWSNSKDDVSMYDVVGNRLVDFNTFSLTENHIELVKKKYCECAKYGAKYYHNVPEWNLTGGPRKNEERIKLLGLDKLDFKNKSVIDLGSAGGCFCRYAKKQGASDVVGVDYPDYPNSNPILAARLVSNELKYWDIDFIELDLRKEYVNEKFNYTLYLSMSYHLGIPDWLPDITKDICIFEDNSKGKNADIKLKKLFKKVVYKGETRDRGEKKGKGLKIFYCYN